MSHSVTYAEMLLMEGYEHVCGVIPDAADMKGVWFSISIQSSAVWLEESLDL